MLCNSLETSAKLSIVLAQRLVFKGAFAISIFKFGSTHR